MKFTSAILQSTTAFSAFTAAVASAIPEPVPVPAPAPGSKAPLANGGPAKLTYTICKYEYFFHANCGMIATYESPSGKQTVNLGTSKFWCLLNHHKHTNPAGFSLEGAGWWDRNFKVGVVASYKGKSFEAKWPRTSYTTDWDQLDQICTPAFPSMPRNKLHVSDTWQSRNSQNHYGSYQLVYIDLPDILK